MVTLTKSDLIKAFKEYGVVSQKDLPKILQEYGVVSQKDLSRELSRFATKDDLKKEILDFETRTGVKLTKLERSILIKITKSKNELAEIIANLAVSKASAGRLNKLETKVENFEQFRFA